jgi:hypothetical protein
MASVMQAQSTDNPIAEVLDGFGARRAAFDDLFFKFNLPEIGMALLVDVIMRRRHRRRQVEVRACLYTREGATVHTEHHPLSAFKRDTEGAIVVANTWLAPNGSRGAVGPISWDLVFQPLGPLLDPKVTGVLHPFDVRLRSVPDVAVSGSVRVERHGYTFSHEAGTVGTTFGRRLPDTWYWVSANAFRDPGVALEGMLLRSRVFGVPFWHATIGYFHLHTPAATVTLLHPLTGHLRIAGNRTDFQMTARARHEAPITVHCAAPETRYHHLGDRIYTTLLGTCEIDGLTLADGTAGLAEREPQRRR